MTGRAIVATVLAFVFAALAAPVAFLILGRVWPRRSG
jgi:uncharacterized membrane protein